VVDVAVSVVTTVAVSVVEDVTDDPVWPEVGSAGSGPQPKPTRIAINAPEPGSSRIDMAAA